MSGRRRLRDDTVFGSLKGHEYDAYEKDIAVASFFFSSPTGITFKKSARITPTGFVAQIGGIFGLCLGFSLLSFVEIVFWLAIAMFQILGANC
jgi:uncharacterized membrane protein